MERIKAIDRLRSQFCGFFLVASITFSGSGCFHQENHQANSPLSLCNQGMELPNHHVYFDPAIGEFVAGQSPTYKRFNIGDRSILLIFYKPGDTLYLGKNVVAGQWITPLTNDYNARIHENTISGNVLAMIGNPDTKLRHKGKICIMADRVFFSEPK